MSSVFRPTTMDDEGPVIEFLTRIFGVDREASFVQPSLLRWKYWEPRTDWPTPRSFVIEKDQRIVAHVGLWPVTVRNGETPQQGIQMIDWASDTRAAGAGVSLLQRLTKSYDFVYSIGGSEMTQVILPKCGFRTVAEARTWARPIRPWRQIRQYENQDWRLPLRLARNIWWSKVPAGMADRHVTAQQCLGTVEGIANLVKERDEFFLQYLQQCPAARCLNFYILDKGRRIGFFSLAVVGEQARIAGVWLENPSLENWRTAFQLAQDAALKHTESSELIARGATEASAIAAEQTGMRVRARTPVFLFRKDGKTDPLPLQFHLCDDDAVFLQHQGAGFLT